MIHDHLDKDNLHHAYLIEGERLDIVPEILKFLKTLGVNTVGNPDFVNISIDNFKIDEAFSLRSMSTDKSLPAQAGFSSSKKVFLVCVNSFSLDAQNVLLKMFEEPKENVHFFLVVPDVNTLLKTLVSRFYLISNKTEQTEEIKKAEKFISLTLPKRIDYIKELLVEEESEDEDGNEIVATDSARSKAIKFLNALETVLNDKLAKNVSGLILEHFFKVREFLRMPGSSTKNLMESIALVVPEF